MTTSLKDEIKTYLGFLEHYDYHEEEIENRTNDIIKIFEKRIDSLNGKYLPYCLTVPDLINEIKEILK